MYPLIQGYKYQYFGNFNFLSNALQMAFPKFLKGFEVTLKKDPIILICTLGAKGTIINILYFSNALQMVFVALPHVF